MYIYIRHKTVVVHMSSGKSHEILKTELPTMGYFPYDNFT